MTGIPKCTVDSAKEGNVMAQYDLGYELYNRGKFPDAKKWLKKAADQGHKGAERMLQAIGQISV